MGRVCHGPSLYGPSLLWAEFVMGRVCYGPSCPVTLSSGRKILQAFFTILWPTSWPQRSRRTGGNPNLFSGSPH